MSEDAVRKRKLREEKRAAAALAKSIAEGGEERPSDSSVVVPAVSESFPPTSTPETANLSEATYTVTIPAGSASHLAWYSAQEYTYSTVEAAIEAGIWSYPNDAHERAKCNVFRDLWEQGHYMGGGIRFGGDYLVYPGTFIQFFLYLRQQLNDMIVPTGDPLRYHSHFVATVIDSPTAVITPMEIVAHGRLGTATKKAHLLCSWDEKTKKVSYYSIEWAGFG